ncbi:nose resistant to fluoxetine protein 6-like [Haliotis cracherodii]|uniref:nose resistant to fluoxetine protein 6-like n=1 Tax=Haliotis cracherodii TaxID=6455 RepID=UPI0039EC09F3
MAMDVSLACVVVLTLITQILSCERLQGSHYYFGIPGTPVVKHLSSYATRGLNIVKDDQKCTHPVQHSGARAPRLEHTSETVIGFGPHQECLKSDIGRQPDRYQRNRHPYGKLLVSSPANNLFKQIHRLNSDLGWYFRYRSLRNKAVRHDDAAMERLRHRNSRIHLQTHLVITLLLVLVTMLVTGTTIDLLICTKLPQSINLRTYLKRVTWCRVLRCFSVYTNTLKLFDVTVSSERLGCLNGIKTLSFFWILFSRLHASTLDKVVTKGFDVALPLTWRILRPYVRGYLTESAYVMSGLQTTLTSLEQKQKGKIDWKKLYLQRYLRATPPAILVLVLLTTFLPYFLSGSQGVNMQRCLPWWSFVTPIKLHHPPPSDCLPQVLSRRTDLLYSLACPLIFLPLMLSPIPGFILSIVASVSFYLVSEVRFLPNSLLHRLLGKRRFGSYIVGVLVGYILFKNKDKIALSKTAQIIGWSCALGVIFFHVFGESLTCKAVIRDILGFYHEPVFKVLWTVSFGWIVIACSTGNGGIINKFLSWKVMAPLSKLGYSSFLTRIAVGHIYSSRLQDNWHYTWLDTITSYTWVTVYALSTSFLVHLLCVAPMGNLVVLLWSRTKTKKTRVVDGDPIAVNPPNLKLKSN